MRTERPAAALVAAVLVHLVVSIAHGAAHAGAHVSLAPAALLFVVVVIQVGPLAGIGLMRVRPAAGAILTAACMAGALVFGIVNHFMLAGGDNVVEVARPWQALFGSTAVLLAVTEAAGAALGAWCASRTIRRAL